jgi:hypothetical protein
MLRIVMFEPIAQLLHDSVGIGPVSKPGTVTLEGLHKALCHAVALRTGEWRDLGLKHFRTAKTVIAGIALMHRIRKGQFALNKLRVQGQAAPDVWEAVLNA